ncbi:hypothetical protein F5Y19DRAFT_479228 [Xylariaceae sp. FL1651]|nr:hypothetical protein F5Y19DRAFT_479228 [Xylariaceae sp. FL1651]
MAKWKELGVVPDSDDESTWDSQEALPNPPAPAPACADTANAARESLFTSPPLADGCRDIWNIPFSSQSSFEKHDAVTGLELQDSKSRRSSSFPESHINEPQREPTSPLSPDVELGPSIENQAETRSPSGQSPSENAEPATASQTNLPNQFATATFEVQHVLTDQETGQILDENSRLGRSLRPRKPIQEHPYLLESAQYSRTLKSHGVRPVRMHAEEEIRKRQQEDSQEKDYEEDSQITANGVGQEDTEEFQGPGRLDPHGEATEIALSDDEPSPSPPSLLATLEAAMESSQEDDDEFPDPADVEKWKVSKAAHRIYKRQASPKASSKQKLPKLGGSTRRTNAAPHLFDMNNNENLPNVSDVFDIPASPPQTSPAVLATTPMTILNRFEGPSISALTPKPSSNISSRMQSPAPANQHSELIDLTVLEDDGSENDSDEASSSNDSEGELAQVRVVARRMRGVLPASWLRLDQQTSVQKAKPTIQRGSPVASPERSARKGVAQRRLVSPHPGNGSALFLHDDSDDSETTIRLNEPDADFHDISIPIFEDDAASVIEEDHVDRMFSGRKRASTGGQKPQKKRRRGQHLTFNGHPGHVKRQQRITGLLSQTESASNVQDRHMHLSKDSIATELLRKTSGMKKARIQPPQLSILDVVEPNAPAFIRIAARTASRRQDRGRSSPSKKRIMLGTRQDNIDAVEILRNWEKGMIRPRKSSSLSVRPRARQDDPPKALPHNTVLQILRPMNRATQVKPSLRFSQPRQMVKQISMDNFVDARRQPIRSLSSVRLPIGRSEPQDPCRPAQLEMAGDTAFRHGFETRKKALDALYRQSRKSLPTSQNIRLEQFINRQVPLDKQQPEAVRLQPLETNDNLERPKAQRRIRPRKQVHPQSVDISAPQYTHANDPLPRELTPIEIVDLSKPERSGKLLGLAPYGSHYTQHFEVFPLDHGVFFHQNTLLGNGRLARALNVNYTGDLDRHRGWCTFIIDEQTLHWDLWDAQTSSEFGIIFDWVLDKLDASSATSALESRTAVQAADFILNYLQDYLRFSDPESTSLFASRMIDLLQNFERRLKEIPDDMGYRAQYAIEVLTRVLVITMQALRLCQKLNKLSEALQVEEVLKCLAAATARRLLRTNLADVREMYGRLQQMPFREKGIQSEHYAMICWVTLIRILEEARLPRAGFWEVVSSAVLDPSVDCTFDTTLLEQAWHSLFTLLPLGEFDNTGVVTRGIRHTAPLEGWTIPQRLLQRVFQIYHNNSRQSPSFNGYFRALVNRCHYLVEQWGWRKCNTILGMIFDFFAAQDLHNLRNEEVYQSPQFLEQLSGSPSLATSPEDRCFHIFLKLTAMSIKRLRKFGMVKEVRNLVARLLPNHNRQYDKMMATHEIEIAALRNHHDLLCTLFWAAPQDMRPSVQGIEGLVVLGSSHKEACLINLRAWSRLSRFVVSSCEDITAYKPLAEWQRNIFQQVLEQFLSVEAEVNQQLLGMPVEASRTITQDHKNAVINKNKKVAMDLLHFSMKAFLDVMRCTKALSAASFVLNYYQLEQLFTRLSFSSANSDWGVLQVAMEILEYYLTRIDGFTHDESLCAEQSWHEEDAVMLLERKLAAPFMSLVRGLIGTRSPCITIGIVRERDLCIERAVVLAGRLATRLVHARLARLRQFFQPGKYYIFQDMSKSTTSPARKYVGLFLAVMIDGGVSDLKVLYSKCRKELQLIIFQDLGMTFLDLFLAEIVKPSDYQTYENRLAMTMKRLGEAYLENAVVKVGNPPDYGSNRSLFNYTIVGMRQALRRADASRRPHLQNQFSKALRLAMDRMRVDLKSMTLNSPEHLQHVDFVRSIITLIRSQDLCPVDSFFYQISQEYSPSRQDPRLQTAGILSWGLKLEEGDSKAVSGLFYLLFPSFKIALANGELENEVEILKEGIKHAHVFDFMAGTMLPAIATTAIQVPESWVLLDTYVEAVDAQLSSACIHRQIGRDSMMGILVLHRIILGCIGYLQMKAIPQFRHEDVVSLTLLIKVLNLFSPSITAYRINEPQSQIANDINQVVDGLTNFTRAAGEYLSSLIGEYEQDYALVFDPSRLFKDLRPIRLNTPFQHNAQIDKFTNHMINDIRENWVSSNSFLTIKGPSRPQRPSTTQSGQGTSIPKWEKKNLVRNLQEQIRAWNYVNDAATRTRLHEVLCGELFL